MRLATWVGVVGLLAGGWALQAQSGGVATDCTRLKSKARSTCEAKSRADAAASADGAAHKDAAGKDSAGKDGTGEMPTAGVPDPPSGEMPTRGVPDPPSGGAALKNMPDAASGEMPTAGVPDPPAESIGPLRPSGAGSSDTSGPGGTSSSSSSSSSGSPGDRPGGEEDDAAPTKAGGDTPVNASSLKDLGSRVDSGEARVKLEQTRVEDDLKVGGFYFKDGNYAGATARYKDALQRDPESPDAHFGLAQVLLKQNKRDEAIEHLQTYVKLAPDDDHTKEAKKLLAKLSSTR